MSEHKETPRYMAVYVVFGGIRGATAPFLGTMLMKNFSAETAIAVSLMFIAAAFISAHFAKEV